MKLLKLLALTLTATALSSHTLAASKQGAPSTTGWSWGVNIDQLNIDKDTAWVNWVDSRATLLGLSAEHFNSANDITYAVGMEFVSYDDENSFSQRTNRGFKSSDASGVLLYIEAGNKLRFGVSNDNFLSAKIGANTMVGSERSISLCEDCYSEKIDIDGGLYGVVGLGHSFGNFDVALNFKQYFTGDLDNSVGLKFSTTF